MTNSMIIPRQISGWQNMAPEGQQRIMDAAKQAGYISNTPSKTSFFMPQWMRGGTLGQLEEQLGRRINPRTMSPEDWQKIVPMASLKGDAYRQYQDFLNLQKEEEMRGYFNKFSGQNAAPQAPVQGAMGRDPRQSAPPMPQPSVQPIQPIQPIPRPVARPTPGNMPQTQAPIGSRMPLQTWPLMLTPQQSGQYGGGVKGFQNMVQNMSPNAAVATTIPLMDPRTPNGFRLVNALR